MTSISPPPPSALPVCPECLGQREYAYHADEAGTDPPIPSRNDTGWHDGWWFKRCWLCRGTGVKW